MAIRVQRHNIISKQAMLLDGLDVSPLKWHVCGCGLNQFVHEGMNHISNVKVHLKTCNGNVNIVCCLAQCVVGFFVCCPPFVVWFFVPFLVCV